MAVQLLLAPAGAGKTRYVLDRARKLAHRLREIPRVIVSSALQRRALEQRLAAGSGSMGVRVLTFDQLITTCLKAAGEVYTELSEPVQYRLLREIVEQVRLHHYAPLTDRPGFIQLLSTLIGELKAGMIFPDHFTAGVNNLGAEPRLTELAQIFTAYQDKLYDRRWADRAGLTWLAVEALRERAPDVGQDWPLLLVDGFDNLTPAQIEILKLLSERVGETVITLTGTADAELERNITFQRFYDMRSLLESTFGVQANPLPSRRTLHTAPLQHLEANLFRGRGQQLDPGGCVELIEAPDRTGEVRAAFRWLKAEMKRESARLDEFALLARSLAPYRNLVIQTAAEFGIPIRLAGGLPLNKNPAVAAVLDLLRLMLPISPVKSGYSLARRPVVEAWRSPFFDWSACTQEGCSKPIGISAGDADTLDIVGRWGRVIEGYDQWMEVLRDLSARSRTDISEDEERGLPKNLPTGSDAQLIRDKFTRFVRRLRPPDGRNSYHTYVGWLEALLGPDPDLAEVEDNSSSLQVGARTGVVEGAQADRDIEALVAFKDILRGLVWSEETLDTAQVDYARFCQELTGAVEAASFGMPIRPGQVECLVADVLRARGLSFRAVAILGLSEGEFPATLTEDPLLRDADRERLRNEHHLPLESSTESAEAEFFYAAVTRPRARLLLTRPRLADDGTPWQASPYWHELRQLISSQPLQLSSESVPLPDQACSWPELMESLAAHIGFQQVRDWVLTKASERQAAQDRASQLFRLRHRSVSRSNKEGAKTGFFSDHQDSHYDGDLSDMAESFDRRYGPECTWSASRLESYRNCPFSFFIGSVLGVEPRHEPAEGLDARQLGNIYHHIFEQVYQDPAVQDPADLEQLLSVLERVARQVLDKAPEKESFRETAWWDQTRQEIVENVKRSLEALDDYPGAFVPYQHEAVFGLGEQPFLVIRQGDDSIRLRGFIDRVDRSPDDKLRIIDYKTGGPYPYTRKAVQDGKKLQLPLYALAARDALGLGEPVEGFYWHIQHAESSGFSLGEYPEALQIAVEHAWEAVRGVRRGYFVPQPPANGCPSYCPGAAFCWHFQAGSWA